MRGIGGSLVAWKLEGKWEIEVMREDVKAMYIDMLMSAHVLRPLRAS